MRLDAISIEPWDLDWPRRFAQQAALLDDRLSSWLSAPIEHIGSTAIPGMPAKPIIDMLALVPDSEGFVSAMPLLSGFDWIHAPEPHDHERRKWSLCFPSIEHRTHHLHVVERESDDWPEWLLFRDYLRAHGDAARQYAELKKALAAADNRDRQRYRNGKAPLIEKLLGEAHAWKRDDTRSIT